MDFDISGAKKIYFIGVGGSSMSSLAEIMKNRGYDVSGSDMQESHYIEHLEKAGVRCHIGQKKENIYTEAPDIIIKTDAIADTNPEIIAAAEKNIPVFRRAFLLGYILDGYKTTIGVAGTHGKTTTSSMITSVMEEGVENPSAIIGGHMKRSDSSFLAGGDEVCVFESCEYKESYRISVRRSRLLRISRKTTWSISKRLTISYILSENISTTPVPAARSYSMPKTKIRKKCFLFANTTAKF